MKLPDSPAPDLIAVEPFSRETFPIEGPLESDDACFVVRNLTDRAILGLTVRWKRADSCSDLHQDSFRFGGSPVAAPGERWLVTPDGGISETVARGRTGFVGGFAGSAPAREDIGDPQLDVVIFSDGQYVGPDEARFVERIAQRKVIARRIAQAVRATLAAGGTVEDAIRHPDVQPCGDPLVNRVVQHELRSLQRAASRGRLEARLAELESLQSPDASFFHRRA